MDKGSNNLSSHLNDEYSPGFSTNVEQDVFAPGLTEDTVRMLSAKKNEPSFLLEWRLKAFKYWQSCNIPKWANLNIDKIDFQKISYFAAPKKKNESWEDVDPEIKAAFEKLGIPLSEQKRLSGVAVDAIFDSVSVATTYQKELEGYGVIFCSFGEAVQRFPDLIEKHLGSVVSYMDNPYAALNAAVFSDGSFVYVPKGVDCPLELSTYFRINAADTGQFERTLIVVEDDATVSYLEGCTAPTRLSTQLHAAVVELVAMDRASIRYSTVQNWFPGSGEGQGGVYNFVTKRGLCKGVNSRISWTQVEVGSAITWKYPSCILRGDGSVGEFYSVAITKGRQQADTGTKMIHLGKGTRSTIISKGISAGKSRNTFRGLIKVAPKATGVRVYSQCDSMLIGESAEATTYPNIDVATNDAQIEHEATTSRISEEQLVFLERRGISREAAVHLVVSGYCREVFQKLPFEFAAEVEGLLSMTLEGTVG